MKTAVIYTSQTGFTKRYAEWLSDAAGADCYELSQAKNVNLDAYEAIVYGGWALAGTISKIGWFKSKISQWSDKKLIAFCVGGSPMENPEIETALHNHFNEPMLESVHLFYCPGGFNYEKMSAPSRLMMKLFIKTLKSKKNKSEADEQQIQMISHSYDISDRKYIEPILQCLNSQIQ